MRRSIGCGLAIGALACEPYDAFSEVACGTADVTFVVTDAGFEPAEATVKYAGQVRWENGDTVEHTVQSGAPSDEDAGALFDSGPLAAGDAFCVEARESGDHLFFEDSGLGGVLTVEARPAGGGGGGGGGGGTYSGGGMY